MSPEQKRIWSRIELVQAARRANHSDGVPHSPLVEDVHQAQLAKLKQQLRKLSTPCRVVGSEEIPTGTCANINRVAGLVSVGTTLCQ